MGEVEASTARQLLLLLLLFRPAVPRTGNPDLLRLRLVDGEVTLLITLGVMVSLVLLPMVILTSELRLRDWKFLDGL